MLFRVGYLSLLGHGNLSINMEHLGGIRIYQRFIFLGGGTIILNIKIILGGASLVAQWLRVCLAMQRTRVRALVWEDPTCRGATRPVSHNY